MFPSVLNQLIGGLESRATFMFDVVSLAMLFVLPVLSWSIYLVKVRRNYALHKRVQFGLGIALLVVVLLFEAEIRLYPGWWERTKPSPYYDTWLRPVLGVHLCFAVSTTALWIVTIAGALRRFPNPPAPTSYSPRHRQLARWAALTMYGVALTGWTFYWMAFVAR